MPTMPHHIITKKIMKPFEIAIIFLSIILVITIGFIIIDKQKKAFKEFDAYCNKTYGENNWTTIYSDCTDACLDPPMRCVPNGKNT
jgi:hypothetical protein